MVARFSIFLLVFNLLVLATVSTQEPFADTKEFRSGYEAFLRQDYSIAINLLKNRPLPPAHLLSDYQLWAFGKSQMEMQNYDAGVDALQDLLRIEPQSLFASLAKVQIARALVEQRKYQEAIRFLDEILPTLQGDERGEALYYLGFAQIESGQRSEGTASLQKAYRDHPLASTDPLATRKLQQLEASAGQILIPPSPDAMLKRAALLRKAKKLTQALEIYDALLRGPSSVQGEARVYKGLCLAGLKRFPEAILLLQSASSLPAELEEESLLALGNSYQRLGDFPSAIATYQKLVRKFPQSAEAEEGLFKTGRIQVDQKMREEGIETFKKLARDYPQGKYKDQALWGVAWGFYRKAEFDRALEILQEMEKGANDAPTRGKAIYWQARVEEKQGNPKKAQIHFQRAAQGAPFSYYGFMALKKLQKQADLKGLPQIPSEWKIARKIALTEPSKGNAKLAKKGREKEANVPRPLKKAVMLSAFGFGKDALSEVDRAVRNSGDDPDALAAILSVARESEAPYLPVWLHQRYWDVLRKAFPTSQSAEQYRVYFQFPFAYEAQIKKTASHFSISPYLVVGLMRQESMFQPWISSHANAQGLMQLLPSTAQARSKQAGIPLFNLFDPENNIQLGTAELSSLLHRFSNNWVHAIAGYNAGPGRPPQWVKQFGNLELDEFIEEIPFNETNLYVKLVLRNYWTYRVLYP